MLSADGSADRVAPGSADLVQLVYTEAVRDRMSPFSVGPLIKRTTKALNPFCAYIQTTISAPRPSDDDTSSLVLCCLCMYVCPFSISRR